MSLILPVFLGHPSDFIGEAATIESEINGLLRTFDNPFQSKCNVCDVQAKSERWLNSDKTRKHENSDWCELICDINRRNTKWVNIP